MAIELCCKCDDPTGRAGRHEDSLYAGDFGPYCEDCWGDVPEELFEIVQRYKIALRKIASLTQTEGLLWWQIEARKALT